MVVADLVGHDIAFGYIGSNGNLQRRVIHVERVDTTRDNKVVIRGFELAKAGYRSFRLDHLQSEIEFVK